MHHHSLSPNWSLLPHLTLQGHQLVRATCRTELAFFTFMLHPRENASTPEQTCLLITGSPQLQLRFLTRWRCRLVSDANWRASGYARTISRQNIPSCKPSKPAPRPRATVLRPSVETTPAPKKGLCGKGHIHWRRRYSVKSKIHSVALEIQGWS